MIQRKIINVIISADHNLDGLDYARLIDGFNLDISLSSLYSLNCAVIAY